MKIAFFDVDEEKQNFFSKHFASHEIVYFKNQVTLEAVKTIRDIEIISVRIFSKISAEILDQLPNLKYIATQSTGFDHIDLAECARRGILVSNVPYYGENTVAEHTFALILALSRNIHKSYLRTISGNLSVKGLRGFDLQGKTLGIIGTGKIGLHVARMAKAFSMNVLAHDQQRNEFLADVLGFHYCSLDEVLASSDIITLHVPSNKSTQHLINCNNISKIKKGALLINTARGKVVQTEAIVKALDEKILAGAALDVIEKEDELMNAKKDDPIIKNHPLLFRDNVVYTPHIASQSIEAQARILQTTTENILSFLRGEKKNLVS